MTNNNKTLYSELLVQGFLLVNLAFYDGVISVENFNLIKDEKQGKKNKPFLFLFFCRITSQFGLSTTLGSDFIKWVWKWVFYEPGFIPMPLFSSVQGMNESLNRYRFIGRLQGGITEWLPSITLDYTAVQGTIYCTCDGIQFIKHLQCNFSLCRSCTLVKLQKYEGKEKGN